MNHRVHRLVGIEPDNFLGFIALLGLLRCLEEARSEWSPRVSWSVDDLPIRPLLHVRATVGDEEIAAAAADGLRHLAVAHEFSGREKLELSIDEARDVLTTARSRGGYRARLCASLVSDKALVTHDAKKGSANIVVGTPLCLTAGAGHQYFLKSLASLPNTPVVSARGRRRGARKTEAEHLLHALFEPWRREEVSESFRWDPVADVRYAYRAGNPSNTRYKQGTQHGANRLAAVGISVLTVFPRRDRMGVVRLFVRGGQGVGRRFTFTWPIWRHAMSLTGIEALLDHPNILRDASTRHTLGVVDVLRTRRISVGERKNFTRATRLEPGPDSGGSRRRGKSRTRVVTRR